MLKKYKVFLASSGELALERKEIAVMISRQNNKWTEKDIYVELVVWEDLLHSFRGDGQRIQDYFNKEMLKCDIVIALFYRKVGQFTEEEFKLAYENLKEGKKPDFLFVYFKSGTITIDDAEESLEELTKIKELKEEIKRQEQIYIPFGSIEDLTQKLQNQLEKAILHKQAAVEQDDEATKEERAKQDLENYKEHLEQKFKYLDFTGLNAILLKPLPLENIYVKLRAKESLPLERLRNIVKFRKFAAKRGYTSAYMHNALFEILFGKDIKEKEKKGSEDFVTLFKRLHKEKQKERLPLHLLILGNPGSGKTTLMKWIALQCLKQEKNQFFSRFIPVFISLKDLGKDPNHTYRKKNIVNLAIQLMEEENISTDSFLDENLKANSLLFLMDGLDEIGDEKNRREVIDWIQKQYIGQNALIVTSRFSGIHEASGLKFRDDIPVFAIRDFEMDDVESFLQNWYRNVEIAVAGEQRIQKAVEEGEKKHKDLMDIIQGHNKLKELAVNPLLLTIIAIVHRTRAVLPKERHKLYEECLKVMIELWNLANRKLDISFSYDNSMSHLSKIAVLLMETQSREMSKKEIEECCLPAKIEGHSRDTFLKEMVVKAGLLYESEGKYGFLHLTFQEFLAAWYFSNSKNQNDILKHYKKNYWEETFRLFVNVGNAELFFDEVIDDLWKRTYWKHLGFWEECLKGIVVENIRVNIEIKFAKNVLSILVDLKNKDFIEMLLWHYPLYQHGDKLVSEGWNLFYNASHPFVQSIGTSVLYHADKKNQSELMAQLKGRINVFVKQKDETNKILLNFLFQNSNTFVLLLAGRRKLTDFNFLLAKLKSGKMYLQYLILWYLWDLREFPDNKKLRNLLASQEFRYLLTLFDGRYFWYRYYKDIRYLRDFRDLLDPHFLRTLENFPTLSHYKYILKVYNEKYQPILKGFLLKISELADRAIEKLHSLSDKQLLKYFPNTTKEEFKQFRESYVEVIASELSKGNCDILKGKKLTKQKQKRIEELVTFDEKSLEQMLDFTLDTQHEEEKHTHHLKAFEILGNKDYEKLYKIIKTFISSHTDDRIRLNALYILKNML